MLHFGRDRDSPPRPPSSQERAVGCGPPQREIVWPLKRRWRVLQCVHCSCWALRGAPLVYKAVPGGAVGDAPVQVLVVSVLLLLLLVVVQ